MDNPIVTLLMVINRLKKEFVVDSIKFNKNGDFYDIIIDGLIFSISLHRISYGVDASYLFLLNQIYDSKYEIKRRPKDINEYDEIDTMEDAK